jgi:hypothetical protein
MPCSLIVKVRLYSNDVYNSMADPTVNTNGNLCRETVQEEGG